MEEQFKRNIKNHTLTVLHDNGLYRHLRFAHNDSYTYAFELVTWRGFLCITGDMGEYVFSRIDDMFEFFRNKRINAGYWAEKCQAADVRNKITEFSQTVFMKSIDNYLDSFDITAEQKAKIITDIECDIGNHNHDDESAHCRTVHEYHYEKDDDDVDFWPYGDSIFDDFFHSATLHEYTPHYLWCLEAIVWGINEYDKFKSNVEADLID